MSEESAQEAPVERNPHGNSPVDQNSDIPLRWKPTPAEPVPVVRCTATKKDGTRCKLWSLRGYHKCRRHAGPGALMPDGNVNKYREAVMEAARLRLLDNTDMALDVIEELMQPGSGEQIRLKASTEILDRAGIRGGFELDVQGEVTVSPSETLRARLDKLAEGAKAVKRMQAKALEESEGDVVDADVVDEDDGQETLF